MAHAKLFSSITDSSLWSCPKDVRLLFITLLAKADATGFFEAALPGLARAANLTIEETRPALEILMAPDPHSKDLDDQPELEGRRVVKAPGGWMVVNYQKYRARQSEEDRREYMRDYMRDYRASKQTVNSVSESKESPSASASASVPSPKGESKGGRFQPPTLEEVKRMAKEISLPEPEAFKFHCYYESNGWKVGRNAMRNWHTALSGWKSRIETYDRRPTSKTNSGNLGGNSRALGQYADPNQSAKTAATVERLAARRQAANRPCNPVATQVVSPVSVAPQGSGSSDGHGAMVQPSLPQPT